MPEEAKMPDKIKPSFKVSLDGMDLVELPLTQSKTGKWGYYHKKKYRIYGEVFDITLFITWKEDYDKTK